MMLDLKESINSFVNNSNPLELVQNLASGDYQKSKSL
jgi:hypothetical protein